MPSSITNTLNPTSNPLVDTTSTTGQTPNDKPVKANPSAQCNVASCGPGKPMNMPITSSQRIVIQNTSSTTTKQALSPEEQQKIKDLNFIKTLKECNIPNSLAKAENSHALADCLKENISNFSADQLATILQNANLAPFAADIAQKFIDSDKGTIALLNTLHQGTIPELLNQFPSALADLLKENIARFNEKQLITILGKSKIATYEQNNIHVYFINQNRLAKYGFNENESRVLANAIISLTKNVTNNHYILRNHSFRRGLLHFISLISPFSETVRQKQKNLILTAFNELKQNLDSTSLKNIITGCYRSDLNGNNEPSKPFKLEIIKLFKEEIIQNPTILQGTFLNDKDTLINLAAISHTDSKNDKSTKEFLQQYLTLTPQELEQSLKLADEKVPFTPKPSNDFLKALNKTEELTENEIISKPPQSFKDLNRGYTISFTTPSGKTIELSGLANKENKGIFDFIKKQIQEKNFDEDEKALFADFIMNFDSQGMLAATYDNTNYIQIQGNGMPKMKVKATENNLQITMSTEGKSSGMVANLSGLAIAQYKQDLESEIVFTYPKNKLSACKHKASDIRVENLKQKDTTITLFAHES